MASTATFGYWLRRRRKALDLTQEALAQQVGCAVVTLRKIEADASRPSRQLAERLADSLAVTPEERPAFLKAARAVYVEEQLAVAAEPLDAPTGTADAAVAGRRRSNLPSPPTALIGRERELGMVGERLRHQDVRLVTLTGPGGTGKTRLALEVASELLDAYPDGVWFVNLALLGDPTLVAPAIAQVLELREDGGRSPAEALKAFLATQCILLLLDNFEQIVDAAQLVGELLAAAPRLKVLATSRTPLRLSGEHEIAVAPLALPADLGPQPLDQITRSPAVQLFVERARAVKADFALVPENAAAVAEICVRLDGLPLAIELAAVRVKLFAPRALLGRMGSRMALLTGGARDLPDRQQTMHSTIDWSFQLLDPEAQRLFARLAVFVGGATLAAIEAVCDPDRSLAPELVDGVAALVDQSLLQRSEGPEGEPRFSMLETIREYALEQLLASGELAALQRRYADYYLALVATNEPQSTGAIDAWRRLLEPEQDNLRAALAWAFGGGDVRLGMQLAAGLGLFWYDMFTWGEGRRWLERALTALASQEASGVRDVAWQTIAAQLLLGAGMLAMAEGDGEHALAHLQASVARYRQLDNKPWLARALFEQAMVAEHLFGDYDSARALEEECLALRRELGDTRGVGWALNNLAGANLGLGREAEAQALFEESAALFRRLGTWELFMPLSGIAGVLLSQGKYAEAQAIYEQCLVIVRGMGNKWFISMELQWLSTPVACLRDYARAAALLEESLALARELGQQARVAELLNLLGEVVAAAGDARRAAQLFAASLDLSSALGGQREQARALRNLGRQATESGAHERAATLLAESLGLLDRLGDQRGLAVALGSAATLEGARGRLAQSARLFGASDVLREATRVPRAHWFLYEAVELAQRDAVRATLGEAGWAEAYAAGRDLSAEAAIAALLS